MLPTVGSSWLLPVVVVVPAASAYAVAVIRLHRRGDRWAPARSGAAAAGFAILAVCLIPPLVDPRQFPMHVVQHLLMAMAAPFALALSAPVTLALRTLPPLGRQTVLAVVHSRLARLVTLAPVLLVLEVGGVYGYYLTPLFAATEQRPWLHVAVHTHMLLAGCLLAWYLVGRDPIPHRPSIRTGLAVLFLAAGSHDVLAKLMYAHLMPHGAGSAAQIQLGAQIMFYGGDVIELVLAATLLSAWYARTGRRLRHSRRRARDTLVAGPSLPVP